MAIDKIAELSEADRRMVNGWLEEFDNNWHEKRLVARVRELPKQGPVRAAALTEMVKIDMDHNWQNGRKVRLEAYLKVFPELGTADTVAVELILAEFQARQGARKPVKIDDFASRFPKQIDELRDLLEKKEGVPGEAQQEALARARRVLLGPSIGVAAETPQPAAQKTGPNAPRKTPTGPVSLPEQFGRYRIIKELGKGGMGSVYLAHDLQLDRKVAVKIPHFTTDDSPTVRERFFREAKAAAHIDHPNVCPVYDVGEINGIHYLTMAYIDGKPLSSLIQKGKPLPQRGVAALVRKLALAMEQAHVAGVVHRDLKPANIMINRRKEPVIMDFGLARRVDKDARMTLSGQILGTPAYMPPEQIMGDIEAISPASDVYSLGVIMYELLTGRVPFMGGLGELMAKIVTEAPDVPSDFRADLDPALEEICLKALAKESDQRYTSMAAMAAALGKYLNLDVAEAKAPRTPAKAAPTAKKPSEAEKLVGQLVDQLVARTEPAESRAAASRRFSRIAIFAAAVFLLGVAVVAVVIYRNSNSNPPNVNVVVQLKDLKELNDPTIVVFILDGKEISKEELSKPINLSVGKHELLTKRGDGSVASRREINIKDASTIEVLPAVASLPNIKKTVPKVPDPKLGAGILESGIGILEVASANSNLNVADPAIVAGVLESGIGVFEFAVAFKDPKVDSKDPNDLVLPFKAAWDAKALEQFFDVVKISYDAEQKQISWIADARRGFRFVRDEAKIDVVFYDTDNIPLYRAVYNQFPGGGGGGSGGAPLRYMPENDVKKGDRIRVILTLPDQKTLDRTTRVVFIDPNAPRIVKAPPAKDPKVDSKDPNDLVLPFKAAWDSKAFQQYFDVVKISYDVEKKQISWTVDAKRGFRFVSEAKLDVDFFDAEGVRLYRSVYNQGSGLRYLPDNAVKKGDRVRVTLTLPDQRTLDQTVRVVVVEHENSN